MVSKILGNVQDIMCWNFTKLTNWDQHIKKISTLILILRFFPDYKTKSLGSFHTVQKFLSFLRIWSHLLEKSLMENVIFCTASKPFLQNFFLLVTVAATRSILSKKVFIEIACNFIKKETLAQVFPVNFVKFLRTTFLQNTSGRLLLWLRPFIFSKFVEKDADAARYKLTPNISHNIYAQLDQNTLVCLCNSDV